METKDRILLAAFKLFLRDNYEKVTIADIERESGLTRGAIYGIMKNKHEIFAMVCDKYILNVQNINKKMAFEDSENLYDFIHKYIHCINMIMAKMLSLSVLNIYRSYFFLIFQGAQYYPGFKEKMAEMFSIEFDSWMKVVERAQKAREIKSDIDPYVVATQFRFVYYGMASERSLSYGLDTEELLKVFLGIYNQIKK